jgi:hypothetical protein
VIKHEDIKYMQVKSSIFTYTHTYTHTHAIDIETSVYTHTRMSKSSMHTSTNTYEHTSYYLKTLRKTCWLFLSDSSAPAKSIAA